MVFLLAVHLTILPFRHMSGCLGALMGTSMVAGARGQFKCMGLLVTEVQVNNRGWGEGNGPAVLILAVYLMIGQTKKGCVDLIVSLVCWRL